MLGWLLVGKIFSRLLTHKYVPTYKMWTYYSINKQYMKGIQKRSKVFWIWWFLNYTIKPKHCDKTDQLTCHHQPLYYNSFIILLLFDTFLLSFYKHSISILLLFYNNFIINVFSFYYHSITTLLIFYQHFITLSLPFFGHFIIIL